jgi:hypothetical protein
MGAESAAIAAAIGNAIKACGVLVRVSPDDFQRILAKGEKPLVICASGGFLTTNYHYLTRDIGEVENELVSSLVEELLDACLG